MIGFYHNTCIVPIFFRLNRPHRASYSLEGFTSERDTRAELGADKRREG